MNDVTQNVIIWAVAIVVVLIAIGVLMLFTKLGAYISTKAQIAKEGSLERILWTYAQEAYAWAEKEGKSLKGSEKADLAYEYLVRMLNQVGINVNAERMKAAIQKAWIVLEKVPRETSTVSPEQVQRAIKEEFKATLKDRT